MGKAWKIVLIVALVLVVAGVLLAGTGLITGASVERVLVGIRGLEGLETEAEAFWDRLLGLLSF